MSISSTYENYILGTHKLSVKTIDLSKSWREIEKQLFAIIDIPLSNIKL